MDKPDTCCWYENVKRDTVKASATSREPESVTEFHERIKQELADMGINYTGFDNEPDPVMPDDF
jgi:hypothetical protein